MKGQVIGSKVNLLPSYVITNPVVSLIHFSQFFFIFLLILVFRVGGLPNQEGLTTPVIFGIKLFGLFNLCTSSSGRYCFRNFAKQ